MKITLQTWTFFHTHHAVMVDGIQKWSVGPLCEYPEDAIIGRRLVDGNNLVEAIRLGYEAAKRGEELVVETEELETL